MGVFWFLLSIFLLIEFLFTIVLQPRLPCVRFSLFSCSLSPPEKTLMYLGFYEASCSLCDDKKLGVFLSACLNAQLEGGLRAACECGA